MSANPSTTRPVLTLATCLSGLALIAPAVHGDTPAGWISSNNSSAYTTTRGALEITAAALAVNDTLDFLDIRDDVVAVNSRLQGNSGDLSGRRLSLHYGLTSELEIYGRYQQHALTVELGEINSLNVLDIDNSLDTEQITAGAKWTVYRGLLLNPDNRHSALSLEAEYYRNESDNFDVVTDEIRLSNLTLTFAEPQTFSVAGLEDEGWRTRLYYSRPLTGFGIASVWLGAGVSEAESATTSDLTSPVVARFFAQQFHREEDYLYAGASLNFRFSPRLPASLSYEYIRIDNAGFRRNPVEPPNQLPGFLASSGATTVTENHTLSAKLSWWLTPRLQVGLSGNLYSNQFSGILPHYNNPLSESFSSLLYGFAGLELGLRF